MKSEKMVITLLFAMVLLSCKDNSLAGTSWLLGKWENKSAEGTLSETWKKQNDSTFDGRSYFISGKDTLFSEAIRLLERNAKWYYIPTVGNQNQQQSTIFKMTYFSGKQLVFENLKHDFPQKITYNRIGNDSIIAEISGIQNGKTKKETFRMKKIN